MPIITSKPDADSTPIAIVDGYYPDERVMRTAWRSYNSIVSIGEEGGRNEAYDARIDRMHPIEKFQQLNFHFGQLEAESIGDSQRQMLHYLIHRPSSNSTRHTKPTSSLVEVIESVNHPNYVMNIFTDPYTQSWKRLRNYVLGWRSLTQFEVANESAHPDIAKYEKQCQAIMASIEHADENPYFLMFLEALGGPESDQWIAENY